MLLMCELTARRLDQPSCMDFQQLTNLRIAQYPLDFAEPIHVCVTAECDDLDYMRAIYGFLQLCGM